MPFSKIFKQVSTATQRLSELKDLAKKAEKGKLPRFEAPDQLLTKEQRAAQNVLVPHQDELGAIKNVRQEVSDALKNPLASAAEKTAATERLVNLYNSLNLEDILQKLPKDSTEASTIRTLLKQKEKLNKAMEQGATSRELHEIGKETFPIFQSINIDRLNKELGPANKLSAAKVAGFAAAGLGLASLFPDESEAGVKGSAAARKILKEKTISPLLDWVSGSEKAGIEKKWPMREALQNQLDLDPTGTAKKEALRRLSALTDVRQNPVTGEHEFKLYRGDKNLEKAKDVPLSFTTDPEIAGTFARNYGGDIYETWVPSSKVGSIPYLMDDLSKIGQFDKEREIITKPFEASSKKYDPKDANFIQALNRKISSEQPSSDFYKSDKKYQQAVAKQNPKLAIALNDKELEKLYAKGNQKEFNKKLSEALTAVKSGSKVAGIGGLMGAVDSLTPEEAKAAEIAQKYLGNPEEDRRVISEGLNTAGEFIAPFSKIYQILSPTETAKESDKPTNRQLTPEEIAALYRK